VTRGLAGVALAVVACGAAAPARADLRSELVGEWNRTYGTTLRFTSDGKCAVAHTWELLGQPTARCTWTLEGDRLTITNHEGLCSDRPEDRAGTYAITVKEPTLRFRVLKDHCPRRVTIDGQTWFRVDRSRPPAAAPAAMDPFKVLAGGWRCVTRDPGDPNDAGQPSRLTIEAEWGGWSQSLRDELRDHVAYRASWGFDAETQKVMLLGRQPLGAWFQLSSPGWREGAIVFAGEMHSGLSTIPLRWTAKRAPSEIIFIFEQQVNGAWGTVGVERCQP
jgi:hypothetical protein